MLVDMFIHMRLSLRISTLNVQHKWKITNQQLYPSKSCSDPKPLLILSDQNIIHTGIFGRYDLYEQHPAGLLLA